MEANSFDINRFSIHDGEGIRSTLFLKGCPLNCPWCQNPEGKSKKIELKYFCNNCIRCGICIGTCPYKALSITEAGIAIDRQLCTGCGECVEACPGLALRFDGRRISVAQAMDELLKDKLFYEITKGGITLSGGEPTVYTDFCYELLGECKRQGLNTAVETCLYTEPEKLLKLSGVVDTFYADIKIFDVDKHLNITGVSNTIILNNFKQLAGKGIRITARIPLIPGFTSELENIYRISRFISQINNSIPVELINYNPLAENKYAVFGLAYPVKKKTLPYSKADMEAFKNIVKDAGVINIL